MSKIDFYHNCSLIAITLFLIYFNEVIAEEIGEYWLKSIFIFNSLLDIKYLVIIIIIKII
jgi:hypothetical protein